VNEKEMKMNQNAMPPHVQVMQFILNQWISKPIYVAAELGIADMLADGPKSIDELANLSGVHAPSLYRMMRALAGVEIFTEMDNRVFGLTPMAECLQTDALRPIARMMHSSWHDKAWGHLIHSIRTGRSAFDAAFGMPAHDWLEANHEEAEVYHAAQSAKAMGSNRAIVDAYDFSSITHVADVGGGQGALMAEILKANSHLTGMVADQPAASALAREYIRKAGLEGRCEVAECDFFKSVPAGSDAYLLSNILHNWDDEACRQILGNCRRAMNDGAVLLVVEAIVPEGDAFSIAKLLDLEMMVMGGGLERTELEYRTLFESAGFLVNRIIPTGESVSVLEGTAR
jgi:hypothetical protein